MKYLFCGKPVFAKNGGVYSDKGVWLGYDYTDPRSGNHYVYGPDNKGLLNQV